MQIFGDIKKTQIKVGLIQHEGLKEIMRKSIKGLKKRGIKKRQD